MYVKLTSKSKADCKKLKVNEMQKKPWVHPVKTIFYHHNNWFRTVNKNTNRISSKFPKNLKETNFNSYKTIPGNGIEN